MIRASRTTVPLDGPAGSAERAVAGAAGASAGGSTATGQTDGQVRVRTERLANAEFRIDIDRGDRQPQRQVGLDKARLIEIVEHVTGERPAALQRLIVTELKEPAFLRIDLALRRPRCSQTNQEHEPAPLRSPIHARCRNANAPTPARAFVCVSGVFRADSRLERGIHSAEKFQHWGSGINSAHRRLRPWLS